MNQLQWMSPKFYRQQMTLRVFFCAIAMFAWSLAGSPVSAQDDAQQGAQESSQQNAAEETQEETTEIVIDEAALAKMTPLEQLQFAADGDVNTRYIMLPRISPRGVSEEDRAEMVRLLIDMLDSDYPDIRARVARALALFKGDAAPAIPSLIKYIDDIETTAALKAVWVPVSKSLSAIGAEHALEPLLEELATTLSVKVVKEGETYKLEGNVDEYEQKDGDRVKYYGITGAISAMGDDAKPTAPVFIELLRNGPENQRWATMFTLSKLGDAAIPAIPDFISNLDHSEFNFKVIACRALAGLGDRSKAAVPKLLDLLKNDKMISTRTHAAMCLGAIGPVEDVDLITLFEEMIREGNAFSQERGLIALGRLGEHAKASSDFVEERLKDESFSQIPEAARTLWQITGDNSRALEILESVIDDPTYDHRAFAVLREMGADAVPMKEVLAKKLETDDASQQQMIAETFVEMGAEAKDQLEALRACLETAPPDVAAALDEAIAKIEGS